MSDGNAEALRCVTSACTVSGADAPLPIRVENVKVVWSSASSSIDGDIATMAVSPGHDVAMVRAMLYWRCDPMNSMRALESLIIYSTWAGLDVG